jgi:hypothetical protein
MLPYPLTFTPYTCQTQYIYIKVIQDVLGSRCKSGVKMHAFYLVYYDDDSHTCSAASNEQLSTVHVIAGVPRATNYIPVCGVVLCCVVLHCIALHCIALHCIALHCIVLCCIVLCCVVLYCIVLCCIFCVVLSCVVLCCIVLYCIVLCCTVLCCIVL